MDALAEYLRTIYSLGSCKTTTEATRITVIVMLSLSLYPIIWVRSTRVRFQVRGYTCNRQSFLSSCTCCTVLLPLVINVGFSCIYYMHPIHSLPQVFKSISVLIIQTIKIRSSVFGSINLKFKLFADIGSGLQQ